MAYLSCNESFQDLKNRVKYNMHRMKDKLRGSTVPRRIKATLKDRRVLSGLGTVLGGLAVSRYRYHNYQKNFRQKAADNQWVQAPNDPGLYKEPASSGVPKLHRMRNWEPVGDLLNMHGVKFEEAALISGTFISNEGIIDDVKNKVNGAVDSVGNFANSVKNRVQTNVGNIANGFRNATNHVKNFAGSVADKVEGLQDKVSNFASDTIGSKNVKPDKPFKVKPVRQL